MAGRVPRMRTPKFRQLVGSRNGLQLESTNTANLLADIVKAIGTAPSTGGGSSPAVAGVYPITYVATGAEGASFMVPTGVTIDASYVVAWAPAGIQNVPLLDLPTGVGDRTSTAFRVLISGELLAAGEKLMFLVVVTPNTTMRTITYAVTGTEGTDFIVPIGATLASDEYSILWSPAGLTTIPLLDLPAGPANRTTTGFRVLVAGALTTGDTLTFFVFEQGA